jgi:hypothetical protein
MSGRWACLAVFLALGLVLGLTGGCGGKEPSAGRSAVTARPAAVGPPEVPGIGRAVIDWQRGETPPIRVVIGIGGVAIGPDDPAASADSKLVPYLYPEPARAADAHYLARTYAPFRARMAGSELVFHGRGRIRPGPVERRMIVEWARRATAELTGGGDAYGLALSWHRGSSEGSCESVSVFLTGEVWAKACAWGGSEVRGRLQSAALGRVYEWFDALPAFQDSASADAAGEAEPTRLVFAGSAGRAGQESHAPTPAEKAAIEGFAAALFRELAAKRGGSPPPPAETLPTEAAGLRLLLGQEAAALSPPLARLAPAMPPAPPPENGGSAETGRRSAVSQ